MTNTTNKPTIFSGIQPSGNIHLGNYLGDIRQWVDMQDDYSCIFSVVDYHAITVKQNPKILKQKIIEAAKIYLAAGIDPKKSVIFQQSDISAHTELAWILNTVARMSDLNKMTQFKDKAGISETDSEFLEKDKTNTIYGQPDTVIPGAVKNFYEKASNVCVALFDYPVLMAADILLYNTDVVPVGDDQKQHVELTRDLAKRFNHQFGETLKVPEVKIKKESARIMGLDNPENKMSKSASSEANYISLTDEPKKAAKKIMRAVTDTGKNILYDKVRKPGITNLLSIYSTLTDKPLRDLEKKYKRKGYGDFKKDLAGEVNKFLTKFQKKFNSINDKEVKEILGQGAEKVRPIAEETLNRAKKKLGII